MQNDEVITEAVFVRVKRGALKAHVEAHNEGRSRFAILDILRWHGAITAGPSRLNADHGRGHDLETDQTQHKRSHATKSFGGFVRRLLDAMLVVLPFSRSEAKREAGALLSGNAGAAPATVSGEPLSNDVTEAKTSGRPDRSNEPRARRPAATLVFVLGRGAPVVACKDGSRHPVMHASARPLPQLDWVADADLVRR